MSAPEGTEHPAVLAFYVGDDPMFHQFQAIALYSLLASLLLALPGSANEGEPKREPTAVRGEGADEKKIPADPNDLIAELHKLEARLLKSIGADVQSVKKSVSALQNDITNIKVQQLELKAQLDNQKMIIDQLTEERKKLITNSSPPPSIDKTSLDEIRSKLNAIENAITKIPANGQRLSMYGPTSNSARVMLVNLYSDDMLFIVNGAPYRVGPGRSRALENIPTGTVNMEVFSDRHGIINRQATSLLAGETYTLTAFRR